MPHLRKAEAIWLESRQRWQINVQKDGQRKTFTDTTPGKKGKRLAENKADKWLDSSEVTIRFWAAWEEYVQHEKENSSQSSYLKTESIGRIWIIPNMPNKQLSAITPIDWQKCIDAAEAAKRARRTCVNVRAAITAFVAFARRSRWEIDAPREGELRVSNDIPAARERRILQPEQVRILFSVSTYKRSGVEQDAFYIHAWRCLVLTGLRRGELTGLLKEDYDPVNRQLHLHRSVNFLNEITNGKNKNARRDVILSSEALFVIESQLAMLKARGIISPWLFPNEQGDISDSNHIYQRWAHFSKQHGMECSIHELRHTYISMMKVDLPLPLLKAQVGHAASMDTIGVYGHAVNTDAARTAEIIDTVQTRILGNETK